MFLNLLNLFTHKHVIDDDDDDEMRMNHYNQIQIFQYNNHTLKTVSILVGSMRQR